MAHVRATSVAQTRNENTGIAAMRSKQTGAASALGGVQPKRQALGAFDPNAQHPMSGPQQSNPKKTQRAARAARVKPFGVSAESTVAAAPEPYSDVSLESLCAYRGPEVVIKDDVLDDLIGRISFANDKTTPAELSALEEDPLKCKLEDIDFGEVSLDDL